MQGQRDVWRCFVASPFAAVRSDCDQAANMGCAPRFRWPGDEIPAEGRRKPKRIITSLDDVRKLRPARTEIIICTGQCIKGGVQIWGDIATGLFVDRKQKR